MKYNGLLILEFLMHLKYEVLGCNIISNCKAAGHSEFNYQEIKIYTHNFIELISNGIGA